MRLFSYVVARDFGFAPNPFYGACTLATCKPGIRGHAEVDDWVIGTGSQTKGRKNSLVYAMRVAETMTFNQYWADQRYQRKKPNLRGSMKQAFGDNIYFKDSHNHWHQLNSHHSYRDGSPNPHNIRNDTQSDRILIAEEYAYWGGTGPEIDPRFRDYEGNDVCAGRGYKCKFPPRFVADFVAWFRSLEVQGYLGDPLDWPSVS